MQMLEVLFWRRLKSEQAIDTFLFNFIKIYFILKIYIYKHRNTYLLEIYISLLEIDMYLYLYLCIYIEIYTYLQYLYRYLQGYLSIYIYISNIYVDIEIYIYLQ